MGNVDSIHKAARLVVPREMLTDWPDCPTVYLAGATGVTQRTAERDRREPARLDAATHALCSRTAAQGRRPSTPTPTWT